MGSVRTRAASLIALTVLVAWLGCGQGTPYPGEAAGHAGHEAPGKAADPHAGHGQASGLGAIPSGYAPFELEPSTAGVLQLTPVPVEERHFMKSLRTSGVVALDETRTAHVHSKVRGWISGIAASFVGRKVAAGETLCSIYSQEVFAAELEFLALLERFPRQAPTGELADASLRAQQQLLEAARRRLSLWDVPRAEIARLEATREPRRTFALSAPRAGVVVAKQAIDGMFIDPSLELYTLSDLSRVWVLADVYEADVPYVRVGAKARLTIEGREGAIEAVVAFLPPTLDEATRTLKMRFDLDNADGALRPGSFVTVALDLHIGMGLAVPESAVIRTGTRSIVFVVHGNHVEPREIKLGPLVGASYRVDGGLTAGELVATSAQFLLDSESRLRASSGPKGGHAH